ncbi:putative pentatricopeptide repeat-containing protein [Forsythia ovata]|uniref:Pentatricopeptide repeat-containing protein n=1 Tax=Forsythia ovata TaxID=205694 RepID=A0ABD1RIW7_9LAMI
MNCFAQAIGLGPPLLFPPNPTSNSNPNNSHSQHRKKIISLLQKCRNSNEITPIHANVIKNGQENDVFIVFELLRVCSKCNAIDYALKIFEQTSKPNVYLCTALIDGLVLSGLYDHGIRVYMQMIENFVMPDNYVISSVLKACGFDGDLRTGRGIHAQATKLGLCSNRSIKLKLLEFYGKCGEFENMKSVFDEMPNRDFVALTVMISCYHDRGFVKSACDVFDLVMVKDTVCWTAMIDGLVRNGEMYKALETFRLMQREGVRGNEVTVVCVLSACAQLGALELGGWIHSYIEKYDIEVNYFVSSALINMYARCGSIEEAERVFEGIKEREVTVYNSMIMGYALHGKGVEAVEMFRTMIKEGFRPTNITFVGVLNACSHGGLVDDGIEIFGSMKIEYRLEPQIEHYGCVVDLLGRVGHLEEAFKYIQNMKISPDCIIWGSLLSACKVHQNIELGERVAQILLDSGHADTGSYVLLSNVYASWNKWEEAALVRAMLKEGGVQKEPGCSSIEVNNEIHEFLLGDIRHPQKEAIYRKLEELNKILRSEGYNPQIEVVSQDITDREKEWALAIHSERLAICYGLISTEPHSTLRIIKNLRVCNDCHSVIKLISKITGRRIVVRDRNRFHHFQNGVCSCGDYW